MRGITVILVLFVYIVILLGSSALAGLFMGKKVERRNVVISRTI